MKQRIISLLVVFALLLSLAPNVFAVNPEPDRGDYYDSVIVSGKCGESAFWSLNLENGKFNVYGEGPMYTNMEYSNWYSYSHSILEVNINEGITSIGRNSFMEMYRTLEVNLPDSLEVIEENAFYGCGDLRNVNFGSGLVSIGSQAFAFCNSLLEAELPEAIGFIGSYAFYDCEDLRSVTIPNPNCSISNEPQTLGIPETTTIRGLCNSTAFDYAMANGHPFEPFDHEHNFAVEEIAPTCTEPGFIEYYCECGVSYYDSYISALGHNFIDGVCSTCGEPAMEYSGYCGRNLTWVYREDTDELIISGNGDMYSYYDLPDWGPIIRDIKSVSLPEGLTSIGSLSFENCVNLTEITIPDSVESIGYSAFLGCENLSKVYFGNSLQEIEDQAFALCAIREAYLPETIAYIGRAAFHGCPLNIVSIPCYGCYVYFMQSTLGNPDFTVVSGYEGSDVQAYAEYFGYTFNADVHTHDYVSEVVEPTCTEEGYTLYTCTVCNYCYEDLYVVPIGHSFVDGICENCGEPEIPDEAPDSSEEDEPIETGAPLPDDEPTEPGEVPSEPVEEPSEEASSEEPTEEPSEEAPSEEPTEETPSEEPSEETPNEKPTEEAPSEEPSEETPNEEPTEETPSEAPSEETPNEKPTEETPSEEPTEETLSEEPTEEAPSEEPSEPIEKPEEPELPKENPFKDVKTNDYFAMPVLWAVAKGVTNGISATSFGPNNNCTRGQIVTFLWRANGSPEPKATNNPFNDVSPDAFYYKAVLWAVEEGVANGMSENTFAPNATCTRGQVATLLWRSVGKPEPKSSSIPFSDVAQSDYYTKAVLWAVENNVTQGMGGGKFAPSASCTRGQIVTFLYRAIA